MRLELRGLFDGRLLRQAVARSVRIRWYSRSPQAQDIFGRALSAVDSPNVNAHPERCHCYGCDLYRLTPHPDVPESPAT
jgi:hypothetical protein